MGSTERGIGLKLDSRLLRCGLLSSSLTERRPTWKYRVSQYKTVKMNRGERNMVYSVRIPCLLTMWYSELMAHLFRLSCHARKTSRTSWTRKTTGRTNWTRKTRKTTGRTSWTRKTTGRTSWTRKTRKTTGRTSWTRKTTGRTSWTRKTTGRTSWMRNTRTTTKCGSRCNVVPTATQSQRQYNSISKFWFT